MMSGIEAGTNVIDKSKSTNLSRILITEHS